MRTYPGAGVTIRIQMVRCGYTLASLAQKTEISPAVLRGILTGRTEAVSTRNLCALARAFDFSVAEFLDLLSGHPPET